MHEYSIEAENEKLRASWNCFPIEHLADYLGVEEQDQRINTHSILNRALLVDALWPQQFDHLFDEELRFGIVLTWLLEQMKAGVDRFELLNQLYSEDSGQHIPNIVRETFSWLSTPSCPLPDYISEALIHVNLDQPNWHLYDPALNIFCGIWSSQLPTVPSKQTKILEVACGSGNDYQALRDFGIGRHISYTGFDISWKNIRNARTKFSEVDFFESSVLNSGLPDNSYDYAFMHDIIGHLSPEGMEIAIREIMRIVRKEVWVHCYNVADIEQHEIRPFDSYFRNRLSISQMTKSFESTGASVQTVVLSDMLRKKFSFVPEYTETSASFLVTKHSE